MRMMQGIGILGLAACVAAATLAPPASAARTSRDRASVHRAFGHGAREGRNSPLPEGVRRIADIGYGDDPAQRLDAYLPAHPTGQAVLLVHGGGWRRGDKADRNVVANKVADWSAQG